MITGRKKASRKKIEQACRHRAVERQRQQQADGDVAGHRKEREAQRVPEDLQRASIGEEALEILQADPARAEPSDRSR